MSQSILITGAAKGFGRLIADTLIDAGHKVIATMRDPKGRNAEHADALQAKGATVVAIDVTDETSVGNGVEQALKQAGHIDILINNAGVGAIGLQEAFTTEDWQKIFDLNVFGVQRMNRAVLPHMRERKQGLIIHVSSLLGRFCMPFLGPYNASKHALEALADNYRLELSGSGVESILVEPGGYATDFHTSSVAASDAVRAATYGDFANAPEQTMSAFAENLKGDTAPNPQMVADAILEVINKPQGQRPFRTVVDGLGMGQPIETLNQTSDQVTTGIYTAFGMESMLKLQ
ncbi:SDR family NAD(P)-dependent oxidoreductase [candidate division GN15 bacterium]|nr:SDR family NAD(P)-dependent oxidoreductase [candidate division GN15 bacterium]